MPGYTNALERYEVVSYLPQCDASAEVERLLTKGRDGLYYVPVGGNLYYVYQSPARGEPRKAYQLVRKGKRDTFIVVEKVQGRTIARVLSDKWVRDLKSNFRLYRG